MKRTALTEAARGAAVAVDFVGIAEDLAWLVRTRSITGDEDTIQAGLADRLEALGLTVTANAHRLFRIPGR